MNRRFVSLFALCLLVVWTGNAFPQAADDAEKPKQAEQEKAADDVDEGEEVDKEKAKKPEEPEVKPLTIGSPAPALDIEHWVQDGAGEFPIVTDFEKNKVYVVEFWATWCGPCISSMPHLAEMQDRYADRDVQIISISTEDLDTVENFLDREVRGADNGATYRDLTSAYCLTTDPDKSSSRDYMRAANQNGIPCAFIVGKQGHVEWIGHPMRMDEPLEQVVSDKWDRASFAAEFQAEQEAKLLIAAVSRAYRDGKIDKAIELLDGYIQDGESETQRDRCRQVKFQILAMSKGRDEEAAEFALELLDADSHDASSANRLSWMIYQMAAAGRFEEQRVTKAALKLVESKVEGAEELQAFLLDTVAHLQHQMGDNETALKTQQRAVEAAEEDQKPRLMRFLKELEKLNEPEDEEKPDDDKVGDDKPAESVEE